MIMQTMPDLKLKPLVSRRKLKGVLKLNESKMFSLCTGHVNQVHYPLEYELGTLILNVTLINWRLFSEELPDGSLGLMMIMILDHLS